MPRLSLRLFGSPRLELDGQLVETDRRKALALLAYLAVTPKVAESENGGHTRESLATLFWSDYEPGRAYANLRHTLWEINRAVGEGWVVADRETVGLNPQADLWVDVLQFQALLRECHQAGWGSPVSLPQLSEAAALYRDHFLAGFSLKDAPGFEEWVFFQAEGLRRDLASALEALVQVQADRDQAEAIIPFARRWVALDPLNEAAQRALMQVYAQAGQPSAALRQYQECLRLLRDELDASPQPETTALYEQIRTGELGPRSRSPAPPPSPARHNLPAQLTSFVGREKEIAEVKALLASPSPPPTLEKDNSHAARLVTLTGPGGTGKTRLALQVAADLLDIYPQGVWFVELAPLADSQFVPQTAAAAIGLREEVGRPILAVLVDYLSHKDTLLILDNCEHLVEACAQFAEKLLRQCPGVRLLITSRETLGVPGEASLRVPSLSTPDVRQLPPLETLSRFEAIQLFVERAAVALPGFALTDDNASAVAQICRRLDGIPLALELAAARVPVLRVEQIAARLDDRFRLLTGGSRTALPRHQTLRALVDWSYNLLSEPERVLLRRLAAFAGGWTLEAAEAVGGDRSSVTSAPRQTDRFSLLTEDILDLLAQLVNKSLVAVEREQGKVTRYTMLETIRQYAREKLLEAGEGETVRDRHLDYNLKLAEQAELELTGPDQVAWLDRLETEHDNVRAALGWSLERDAGAGLRLAGALDKFWEARGYLTNGYEWLSQLLKQAGSASRSAARALALLAQGDLYQGEFARAHSHAEESLALYRKHADRSGEAFALYVLGTVACVQDDYGAGRALVMSSLALYRELGDKLGLSEVLGTLGVLADNQDYRRARMYLEESLKLCRELGHLAGIADRLNGLGLLALRQGDYAAARPWFEEGVAIQRRLGERGIANSLARLGELALRQEDYEQARLYLDESLSLSRATGQNLNGFWSLANLGYVALRQGETARARALFEESQGLFREAGSKIGVVYALEGLGSLAAAQGQPERAARLFGWADATREVIGDARPPAEQVDVDRDRVAIRTQLDEAALAAARAEGRAMTLEQAVDYALGPARR